VYLGKLVILIHYRSILIVCCAVALATVGGVAYGDEFLKGNITDTGALQGGATIPMATPVLTPEGGGQSDSTRGNPLTGSAQQSNLKGNADENGANLQSMQATPGHQPFLSGQANETGGPVLSQEDPDAGDQQLKIDWDNWRNRFIFQVQDNLTEEMNNNSDSLIWNPATQQMVQRWPLGTMAWFYCSVTPDRRIVNLRLVHSSGYASYDRAVLQAVNELNGSTILAYPPRSKRGIVTQVAGIKTATTTTHRYMHYGDIERRTIP